MTNLIAGDIGRLNTVTDPSATDEVMIYNGEILETTSITDLKATATVKTLQINSGAKIGATAGWSLTGDNGFLAECPASQTAATLAVPISNLTDGDEIAGFSVRGAALSGGNTVTLDADIIKVQVNSDGSQTETTIGSISQISETSNTRFGSSDTTLSGTNTVSNNISYYILLTATTAASTSIELNSVTVTVNGN